MSVWPAQVQRDLEVRASYAGYIERAMDEIERAQGQQDTPLPAELDYATLGGLSNEVRQKLMQIRPATIGQAARVPGRDARGGIDPAGAPAPARRARGVAPLRARALAYLRQKAGVSSTAKVMICTRPRNMAAMQVQLWKSDSAP
jgi:hypothetical protein